VWHLQANDNSLGGWLATGIYAALIVICWWEVLRPTPAGNARARALKRPFWIWLSLGVTAVGINKQLDLQTLLVQFGRSVARSVGMMEYRRLMQAAFAVAAAAAAAAIAAALWRLSKRGSPSERLVIIGVCGLIGFVVLRIATFNHIDILTEEMAQQRPILALELAVVAFLCFAVWRNGQTDSSRRSTR
jgi:hypothetical protein